MFGRSLNLRCRKDGTQDMHSLRVALVNAGGVPESRQQARLHFGNSAQLWRPPSVPGPGTLPRSEVPSGPLPPAGSLNVAADHLYPSPLSEV